jgi:hypothetical protein
MRARFRGEALRVPAEDRVTPEQLSDRLDVAVADLSPVDHAGQGPPRQPGKGADP